MASMTAEQFDIEYYEKKFAPKRKKEMTKKEEKEYFCFIERIIKVYEKRCKEIDELNLNNSKNKKYDKSLLDFSFKDVNIVEKSINTNHFDGKAKYVNKNGKRVKTYNYYSILYVARLLRLARQNGKKTFKEFVMIPDVVYVVKKIRENEFHDLDRFMGNLKRIK